MQCIQIVLVSIFADFRPPIKSFVKILGKSFLRKVPEEGVLRPHVDIDTLLLLLLMENVSQISGALTR